jgi:surfactin synthase thioesterase subunit
MTRWVTKKISQQAAIRLFCFPFAGGGASCFSDWNKFLGDDIAVCSVQLPGRESRFHEPRFTSFKDLIDELYDQLVPYLEQPYAFYGHSLGALIAYSLTYQCYLDQSPLPLALFVGAHCAPHLPHSFPSCKNMNFQEIRDFLLKFGGFPQEIVNSPEWMEVLLPIVRDDFLVCESYNSRTIEALPCPLFSFGGLLDKMVSYQDILAWRCHTTQQFESYFYSGGHFFLKTHKQLLLEQIQQI